MAELTTHHELFDRVSAGRSLRFEATVSTLADLEGYAKEALRLYRRDDYTKSDDYSWIDYTIPVGDVDEVNAVLDEIWVEANRNTPLEVDLVWADADLESGRTPAFVLLPHEVVTSFTRPDLPWQAAMTWLNTRRPGIPGRDALRTRLRFYYDDRTPSSAVELWQLAVAQVSLGGESFFVSDGEVWRVSDTHIQDIDNLLATHVTVNPPYLPLYTPGEQEGPYNERARTHGKHFLLDKNLVKLPGQTSFEPCDLLSADGHFMHVKRKSRSSTMSHAVTQALAATRLLRTDQAARLKLDGALLAASPPPPGLNLMRAHCDSFAASPTGTIEIVIIGSWRGTPDIRQLPLLTRIALNNWIKDVPCARNIVLVGT